MNHCCSTYVDPSIAPHKRLGDKIGAALRRDFARARFNSVATTLSSSPDPSGSLTGWLFVLGGASIAWYWDVRHVGDEECLSYIRGWVQALSIGPAPFVGAKLGEILHKVVRYDSWGDRGHSFGQEK